MSTSEVEPQGSPQNSQQDGQQVSRIVQWFVGIIFALLGLSFLATTGTLVWEFAPTGNALPLAAFYSHLFIFFPTFGIVALVAFYTPACVFMDMYVRNLVPRGNGPFRFTIGFLFLIALSGLISEHLKRGAERSVFEIAPSALVTDRGSPQDCAATGQCSRMPVMQAIGNVRRISQARVGLTDLSRNCEPDPLKTISQSISSSKRYCFASTPLPADLSQLSPEQLTTDPQCCRAQQQFAEGVHTLYREGGASYTHIVHSLLLPAKVFFLLVLFVIAVMLALLQKSFARHYPRYQDGIVRGVLIGAIAVVVFPVMINAFLELAGLLFYGSGGFRAIAGYLTYAVGIWGLLLLVFFYQGWGDDIEIQRPAQILGVLGSAFTFLKYDQIIDIAVRFFGTGASLTSVVGLCVVALLAVVLIFVRVRHDGDRPKTAEKAVVMPQPAAGNPPAAG